MNGFIRVIGGKWRGRKLPVLDSEGLRPTTDRVKETLFNWLMPAIHDSTCLDCFAGSGSLGFEALSRGAQHVTMLEKQRATALQLEKNKHLLQSTNCSVVNTDALNWLSQSAKLQFDIVFIDPPFHQMLTTQAIAHLENGNWLSDNAYIYVETEKSGLLIQHIPSNWTLHREKTAGQVHSYLFIREKR
ncbi:16S rRNA m(2)G-966 methyltransferase [Orbus hercynius]|uniref:Ribosomal RNA small subunit methyltransferase D n=1 Tax=Orbus hercynius TaxID=593135 RepID=A0A495RAZ8_9GAMM|nr:16S rRNA (guanine(966)-N(2))-methyltransferase RsmD [Orbus hercynius]RKS84657.1 16S rRNA m(2)G-966 methyltransferase [Orbus hercynius]